MVALTTMTYFLTLSHMPLLSLNLSHFITCLFSRIIALIHLLPVIQYCNMVADSLSSSFPVIHPKAVGEGAHGQGLRKQHGVRYRKLCHTDIPKRVAPYFDQHSQWHPHHGQVRHWRDDGKIIWNHINNRGRILSLASRDSGLPGACKTEAPGPHISGKLPNNHAPTQMVGSNLRCWMYPVPSSCVGSGSFSQNQNLGVLCSRLADSFSSCHLLVNFGCFPALKYKAYHLFSKRNPSNASRIYITSDLCYYTNWFDSGVWYMAQINLFHDFQIVWHWTLRLSSSRHH